ncbi:MAG: glycosyltransferase, partial [Demequina sp.]|nr:glycosyltransferase [Demequina sp.]
GLAALESLASGTPAVVNAASALPEVVGDAGEAVAGTPEAFADAIEAVLARDAGERRETSRARAETMPWSATVERMLALHEAALDATQKERDPGRN